MYHRAIMSLTSPTILSIETSCDETALSIITAGNSRNEVVVLADIVHSQIEMHKEYGGVFPAVAKREHAKNLIPLFKTLLADAGFLKVNKSHSKIDESALKDLLTREPVLFDEILKFIPTIEKPPIDYIGVTKGPGLEPALWVGINFAIALGQIWNIPVVPTHHMEGHILSALLKKSDDTNKYTVSGIEYPALALLVSGGHTELVKMDKAFHYELIGQTLDDAVGEAFDKVARLLGLPYPGGPEVSRLAKMAREQNLSWQDKLPRPLIHNKDFNFSYSGLKTAVLYSIKRHGPLSEDDKMAIAGEFEDSAIEVLVKKTRNAVTDLGIKTLLVGGGVVANTLLRKSLEDFAKSQQDFKLYLAPTHLSGDNSLMTGFSLLERFHGKKNITFTDMNAKGTWRLTETN